MTALGRRLGEAIRREREAQGLSAGELARRSSVSKATLSQLESGTGNPTVETLWAIADTLGVPFASLVEDPPQDTRVIRAAEFTAVPSSVAPYTASLISASPPGVRRDLYLVRAAPGGVHPSVGHQSGTIEHVLIVTGTALVGPSDDAVLLGPGDYITYAGDAPHVFEATDPDTTAILMTELRSR